MQTENGDVRRKAYDVFPQVIVSDLFMKSVEENKEWYLLCPYEVEQAIGLEDKFASLWGKDFEESYKFIIHLIKQGFYTGRYKVVNAKDLFKHIMKTQIETGLPYIIFKDQINRMNPNKHDGYIPQANLCVESYSNVTPDQLTHTCNLVSLNLANIEDDELEYISSLAVVILDNTIDITETPIKQSNDHNNRYRTIGIGAMGLADWLAKKELRYTDTEEISDLFENIAYYTTYQSCELAKERGAYPAFPNSEWSRGNMLGGRSLVWFKENSKRYVDWCLLSDEIMRYGIRNSHIMAIAPNTSSSLLQGCTASILPIYSKFYYDKSSKGSVPIAPPFIKDKKWFYRENKTLDQNIVVNAVAAIQPWVDTGISMELLFNLNANVYGEGKTFTAKDMYEVLMNAWKKGLKTVYYIRSVQKDNFGQSDCSMCTN